MPQKGSEAPEAEDPVAQVPSDLTTPKPKTIKPPVYKLRWFWTQAERKPDLVEGSIAWIETGNVGTKHGGALMDKTLNIKRIRSQGFSDSTCSVLWDLWTVMSDKVH